MILPAWPMLEDPVPVWRERIRHECETGFAPTSECCMFRSRGGDDTHYATPVVSSLRCDVWEQRCSCPNRAREAHVGWFDRSGCRGGGQSAARCKPAGHHNRD